MAGGRKRFGIALYVQHESMYAMQCPAHEFALCWLNLSPEVPVWKQMSRLCIAALT